jgi:hypothetical protein
MRTREIQVLPLGFEFGFQKIQVRIKMNQVKISVIDDELEKYRRRMCRRLSEIV